MQKPTLNLLSLVLLTGYASIMAVLVTPALPAIGAHFQFSQSTTQAVISLYLLGYTLGQWMYGPITQRFGRKPTLYIGLTISLIGSLSCLIASYSSLASLFLFGRFIEALGGSVGLIVSLAMIHDIHEGNEARRVTAIVMLAFAMLPGIAVLIGGQLLQAFTWHSDFIFLLGLGVVTLAISTTLPETSKHLDKNAFTMEKLFFRYGKLFKHRETVRYAAMWGTCTAVIYILSAILPLIAIGELHANPAAFSYAFLSTTIGLMTGNAISAKLAHKKSARHVILYGFCLFMMSMILLPLTMLLTELTLSFLFISLFPAYIGMPMIFSNASTLATQASEDKTTAASFVTLLNLSIAVIGSSFVEALHFHLLTVLPFVLVISTGLIGLLYMGTKKQHQAIA